jgi:hypothetical protein
LIVNGYKLQWLQAEVLQAEWLQAEVAARKLPGSLQTFSTLAINTNHSAQFHSIDNLVGEGVPQLEVNLVVRCGTIKKMSPQAPLTHQPHDKAGVWYAAEPVIGITKKNGKWVHTGS